MGRIDKRAHKKTRKRTKDIDQIFDEVQPDKIEKSISKATEPDEDLPALGQFYCIACHRYFKSEEVLKEHNTQKTHKRRYLHNVMWNLNKE